MDISLDIYFTKMKFCIVGQNILLERSPSQNVEVLFLILCETTQKKKTTTKKTGNLKSFFVTELSRNDKIKPRTTLKILRHYPPKSFHLHVVKMLS